MPVLEQGGYGSGKKKKNPRSWNLKQETWGFTSTAVHFQLYSKSKSAMMKANLWSEIKAFSRSIEGLNPALIKWQVLRAVDLGGLLCSENEFLRAPLRCPIDTELVGILTSFLQD